MKPIPIPIQQLPTAAGLPLPAYQTPHSAGLDLAAAEDAELPAGARLAVGTGLAIALPDGYEAQVRPRSGLALRHGVTLLNAPGTIDADYRGEIRVILVNLGQESFSVRRGDRIAQLVVAPVARAVWHPVTELAPSERGGGGFGSTGGLSGS